MSTLIIAEIGSVHDGDHGKAKELAELAKDCGADVVKYQTHIAEAETLKDAPNSPWFTGEPRFEYFTRTGFTLEEWKDLKAHCDSVGIEFASSAFSIEAVDLLEEVGVKRHKVPSGEVTNIPFLEHMAKTKKQVLLSSGMSSWEELDLAVETIKKVNGDIVVMQCTSEYPCPPELVGLNILDEMKERYKLPIGFSDHMLTNEAAFVSVAKGAVAIEKHLTPSRDLYGSDAKNSLLPEEFKDLVRGVRALEKMIENPIDKGDVSRYSVTKEVFEKSVVSVTDIAAGTVITAEMIGCKKPGSGIPAKDIDSVIGKTAKNDINADTLIDPSDLS